MKSIATIFICCFLLTSLKAQQYHPLVDSGAVWTQTVTFGDWNNWPIYFTSGYDLFLAGDTMVQTVKFMKLWVEQIFGYTISIAGITGGNISTDSNLLGGLYEDADKKVWFKLFQNSGGFGCNNVLWGDSLYLMYDFGVSVNDTIESLFYPTTIHSIDSVQLLNGEFRKRFWLDNEWGNEVWIEGIGSSRGILSSQDYLFECLSNLNCFHKNGEHLYSGNYDSSIIANCDSFILGIDDFGYLTNTFEISPNPATDFLSINFSSPNFSTLEIKIVDLLGRNLFSDEIKSGETKKISTEKFSGSIFFCQLWQNNHLLAVKKMVIQK